jgi:CDP-paratose 2-epimerase
MKLLVSGGAGFIGSHVCESYAKHGATVIAYDNLTKFELNRTGYQTDGCRQYNIDFLKNLGVEIIQGDIRNIKQLDEIAKVYKFDYIIHTAAQPAVTISIEQPCEDFTTNVMGTVNLLEIARKYQIPIVSCATIHVYGNELNQWIQEDETRYNPKDYLQDAFPEGITEEFPLGFGTLSPLHASKISADTYVRAYIDTYKIKAASFRLTGLYGTRQFGGDDHGWVSTFAIRTLMGLPINIYGTGKQIRDILYATDAVTAFESFYLNQRSGVYNIGGGIPTSTSLLECLGLIKEITGITPEIEYKPFRHGDLQYFICDNTKAKRDLAWNPIVMPRDGITKMIEWIRDNIDLFRQPLVNPEPLGCR